MNWHDVLAMNGDGAYVWGSFGIGLAMLAGEVAALARRIRRARRSAGLRSPGGAAPFAAAPLARSAR
jgi:heme exporter protein CcmD